MIQPKLLKKIVGNSILAFTKTKKNNPKEQQLQQANVRTIEIKNEISLFRKLILEEDMIGEDCISTRRFWLTYRTQLPNLFSLTKILLNILTNGFCRKIFQYLWNYLQR